MSNKSSVWFQLKQNPFDVKGWQLLLNIYAKAELPWQQGFVSHQMRLLGLNAQELESFKVNENGYVDILGGQYLSEAQSLIDKFMGWLHDHPEDWLTWTYVARLHDFVVPFDANAQKVALENAKDAEYIAGESLHMLGLWRLKSGNLEAALSAMVPLVNLRPLRYGSMMYLGLILLRLGQIVAAEKAFSRASLSDNPQFLGLLASKVYEQNYWQESIEILKKALSLAPEDYGLWLQLAQVQLQSYRLADCKSSLLQAQRFGSSREVDLLRIRLEGLYGDAKAYLSKLQNYYDAQEEKDSRLISSILMTALYQDDITPEQIADIHKQYCSQFDVKVKTAINSLAINQYEKRDGALRIGYVTGDLHRQHPVNIFMLPLLQEQRQQQSLQIYIYHTGTMHDDYTARAQKMAHQWIEAGSMTDTSLHEAIVRDEIDVLIDLSGHTSSHRLGVFLNRPAPVQASFLGYPHSTGLSCIDYLIGDRIVSPPEHAHLYTEKIAQVEGAVFCWAPVDEYPLPKARDDQAPIVFGSFNNALKLSPKTLALWSKVLLAVPKSKLLLKAPSFADQGVQDRYRSLLLNSGITPDRLEFRGPTELSVMMQEYGDIDIALDPLRYNGGTTSLQALWMGVPLVTMLGGNFASRMGASFLSALGKGSWIAEDEQSYIGIAQRMADDVNYIRQKRAELRAEMASSPLCDIRAYAKKFEELLRYMHGKSLAK